MPKRNAKNVAWTKKMNAAGWFPCGAFEPEWCDHAGTVDWENENSGRRIGYETMTDLYWRRHIPTADGGNEADDDHEILQMTVSEAVALAKKENGDISFGFVTYEHYTGQWQAADPVTGRGPRYSESELTSRLHIYAMENPSVATVCRLDVETKFFEDAEIVPDVLDN